MIYYLILLKVNNNEEINEKKVNYNTNRKVY
jgi:hypothetical protein